jgi:hypothetical protein
VRNVVVAAVPVDNQPHLFRMKRGDRVVLATASTPFRLNLYIETNGDLLEVERKFKVFVNGQEIEDNYRHVASTGIEGHGAYALHLYVLKEDEPK